MSQITNPNQEKIAEILKASKTIAVVGLSDNPSRTSYQVSKVMQQSGYSIIPVNPNVSEVLGINAVPSLKDIETPVDIVDVFRRSEHLPAIAKEAADMDITPNVFWTQLGLENEEAFRIAENEGMIVIMNKCIKVEHSMIK
ncbi:putative CoA-binding protein [Salibacterium salarium]|uniref:CoA-binding protein n=1 Tax=Salibacterium salarium TaxID=284579 RepID=UPI002781A536|nr:CoA-binding protein [Salibacterium salarium]MDQ0299273.1 putative CoA-binding protein [Salibacterium salarium]